MCKAPARHRLSAWALRRIDLYYGNRRNPVLVEDMVGTMSLLVKADKVKQLGLSVASSAALLLTFRTCRPAAHRLSKRF